MISAQSIYSFSATAQAAYAGFVGVNGENLVEKLQTGINGDPLLTKSQAESFASEWRVVQNGHMPDQDGGRAENGGYTIAGGVGRSSRAQRRQHSVQNVKIDPTTQGDAGTPQFDVNPPGW